jgi:hypothetical protein
VAETSGLVQRLTVGESFSCVWIGPQPTNTELLLVTSDGSAQGAAFAASLVDTLSAALTNYRAVTAVHGNNNATITGLRIDPV